ncbi:hypothetical protein [Butyrivibrio sp. MB2005]|uniref:hypothetical protein n=1 Tax=Butyrivibrio sp. MB2005 TaxID=1280678 RepID=UPI000426C32F|nr:hypothetical protein [Butyrivibrio sp. MB2005]
MEKRIELLDCTLRDGAYIVDAKFGTPAIKGIISKMQEANVEIIECGWLKNTPHVEGTSFFHVPDDVIQYITKRDERVTYVTMIDWDRYDLSYLPECDHKSIDAIRVVFPHGKHREGIEVAKQIRDKGYQIYLQAANTLAYSNDDLKDLASAINELNPVAISVVDTFGAMYEDDLDRIIEVLDGCLDRHIKLGFHSHNNQQLSFALTMHFVERLLKMDRQCIVDASLCGMGRGAGNATTELVTSYLNKKHSGNYDMNAVMDAIDMYMEGFKEKFSWGYSTPYFIAGLYCCHVNNIAYLLKNHRTNARDMRNIIESLSEDDRKKYDYDLLEEKYLENQNRIVDDEETINALRDKFKGKEILFIAPGKSVTEQEEKIKKYIEEKKPVVIGINAIHPDYDFDYLFLIGAVRYEYAKSVYPEKFNAVKRILLSSIKTVPGSNEMVINFNRVIKRGWEHFDNAVICGLRFMDQLNVTDITLAGFDGFKNKYNESYADASLPTLNPDNKWDELNEEITDMFLDFKKTTETTMSIKFLTESIFNK